MALNKRKALKELVKELEKNYLLQRACNKLGLTRSTVYRWMQDDEQFASAIRNAQAIGRRFMSDFVESKLLKNIDNQEQRAIEFWLKNNNENYRSHEKAYAHKIASLTEQLGESRAALAATGKDGLFKQFIDWQKVEEYVSSPEFKERERLRKGIYSPQSPHEKEILEQVHKILMQIKLAEYIAENGGIPEENQDLTD